MIRKVAIFLFAAVAGIVHAQQQAFSVATIRPSAPDSQTLTQIRGKRFVTEGTTFLDLFRYAYGVHESQVVGGPDWLRSEKFDVVADPEGDQRPSSDQMKMLVRQLLVERFRVVMHGENRELPVFALQRVGARPLKFSASEAATNMPAGGGDGRGNIGMRNGTMRDFAVYLQRFAGTSIDRPVVDETGLEGRYDLDLHFTPDTSANPDANTPGLFTALEEQLGLKLKRMKAQISVYVIGSATHPALDS
jgi:uncharacterized protein (TIGR03435 family)